MTMHANSKASKALAVVREGPSTTGEVAAELGWSVHLTCAHLGQLFERGKITRERFPMPDSRVRYLWMAV